MSLPNRVVVMVMRRSDLDTASSEVHFDHLISNNDYLPVRNEGVNQFLTDQVLEPFILRIPCATSVSEHSFDTSGGDFDELSRVILESILKVNNDSKLSFLLWSWT